MTIFLHNLMYMALAIVLAIIAIIITATIIAMLFTAGVSIWGFLRGLFG